MRRQESLIIQVKATMLSFKHRPGEAHRLPDNSTREITCLACLRTAQIPKAGMPLGDAIDARVGYCPKADEPLPDEAPPLATLQPDTQAQAQAPRRTRTNNGLTPTNVAQIIEQFKNLVTAVNHLNSTLRDIRDVVDKHIEQQ